MRRSIPTKFSVLFLAAGVLVAGCSTAVSPDEATSPGGLTRGLVVSGEPGVAPVVRITAPLNVAKTSSMTLVRGVGEPAYRDRMFVLQLTMFDGKTGKQAISTYDQGQTALAVTDTDTTLFPVLSRAVIGKPQGSRVVVLAKSEDAYGDSGAPQYGIAPGDPVVMIADIVAVPPKVVLPGPQGSKVALPAGQPRLRIANGVPTGFGFGSRKHPLRKPRDLVVVPLIRGDGPAVTANGLVTLNYLGQLWGTTRVIANTYAKEPVTVPLGVDRVIEAWDRALVGVRRGSRILVITPPRLAFKSTGSPPEIPGRATLVYVLDVLGVS